MAPEVKMVILNHIKHNLLDIMFFIDPESEEEYQPAQLYEDDVTEVVHCNISGMPPHGLLSSNNPLNCQTGNQKTRISVKVKLPCKRYTTRMWNKLLLNIKWKTVLVLPPHIEVKDCQFPIDATISQGSLGETVSLMV